MQEAPSHTAASDPALRARAQALVRAFVQDIRAVQCCMLSTEDGMEIAAHTKTPEQRADQRFSAMSSSMAALGAVAGQEYQLGACSSVIIEAENGYIIVTHVHSGALRLVLGLVTRKHDTVLAEVLYHLRAASEKL